MSRQRSIEAISTSEYVTIGELVRLTGTRYSTLKFYTQEGFLPFWQPDERLTRRYLRSETVERIAYIKKLRQQGNTIAQVREILNRQQNLQLQPEPLSGEG
ncbi:MAG: helix-turn-helix domain-containing protein [Pygmaiobacter massiliensis]|jgi:DNA-binding transcriptional MerR regulator|nr:helix-turn-helix domain-containing protein [Pygmaiobacter massiliensis]